MSKIEAKNVDFYYGSFHALKDINMNIEENEVVAFIGPSGCGKSTFLRLFNRMNDLIPGARLEGTISIDGQNIYDRSVNVDELRKNVGMVFQRPNPFPKSIYENVAYGLRVNGVKDEAFIAERVEKSLKGAALWDEVKDKLKKSAYALSGGQRAKVMLCKLILENPDVMLLDEPTNFLDVEHIDWLEKYLCSLKKTYIVISHDTDFLDAVCDHIVSIENGSIRKYTGNYSQFVAQHDMAVKQYAEDYQRQQAEIKKMEDYINRNKARASTAGMANSRKKMLERIDVMQKPVVSLESHFSFPCEMLNTRDMLKVDKLVVGYDSPLLPPISFEMRGDTKLWIWGANGIGKSTLLKTLMGVIPPLGGTYNFHIAAKPAYLEQDVKFSDMNINSFSYISECFPRFNQKEVRSQLARVGIRGEMSLQPIKTLSGGEQVRVKLLTIMNRVSNILILDEPTNHLDVAAKESLKKAIAEYAGAVILVSHDRAFAESVCDMSMRLKEL